MASAHTNTEIDQSEIHWREIITAKNKLFSFNVSELWDYRDLLIIFTKRDISAIYKQTILGPLWFFLQPALTTVVYLIVFSRAGRISTGSLPPVLFYLSGLVIWMFFSDCVLKTAGFLKDNSNLLSKVYFPRFIIPLSIVLTNLVKFAIQFCLFLCVYIYFLYTEPSVRPNIFILLFPLLLLLLGVFGLAAGVLVASLTTRYKDLSHLISFATQLLMFGSPIIFPLDTISQPLLKKLFMANPITGIIEAFRFGFTGTGTINWQLLGYDFVSITALLLAGIVGFNMVERKFVDTI